MVAGAFISESSIVNKLWQAQNKKDFFSKALNIYTLTEGMADTLSKYVNVKRIKVIQPWSLLTSIKKIEKINNRFINLHNLKDYFLVMYSGNIGLGHNVESVNEGAKILKEQKDLMFIIIGDKWNKRSVEKLIADCELNNCLDSAFSVFRNVPTFITCC